MKKNKNYPLIIAALLVPVILYFYFLQWETTTIYGDDLATYTFLSGPHDFFQTLNISRLANKFRPINGIVIDFLLNIFHKNLHDYYLFNIFILTINTLIFARILNLFLKSRWIALFFSLTLGLSRFSFFNVTQLFIGGPLEGLAMTFFLCSLFYILDAAVKQRLSANKKENNLLWSILFANLAIYTHERYIVLFPFLVVAILLLPDLKMLSLKQKLNLSFFATASVVFNIVIKKKFLHMPFFVGTGGTNIQFSFSAAFNYLIDGSLSIFQINSQPEYLTGLPFAALTKPYKLLSLFIAVLAIFLLVFFLIRSIIAITIKKDFNRTHFFIFLSLSVLFIFSIAPAIVTIRLEQRWLQAPFSVFIVMLVIAFCNLPLKNNAIRYSVYFVFIALFLASDYHYLNKGGGNIYMMQAQRSAEYFKKAVEHQIIQPQTETLYYWVSKRDENGENGVLWAIGNGDIFKFYQNNSKKIIFIDSVYQKLLNSSDSTLLHFNREKDQFIDVNDSLIDITGEFIKDSLKNYRQ